MNLFYGVNFTVVMILLDIVSLAISLLVGLGVLA